MNHITHFRDGAQEREHRVTVALSQPGPLHASLVRTLRIDKPYWVTAEFDKAAYGRKGDVDLAFLIDPGKRHERLYALEVKVAYLDTSGILKSEKKNKHHKQLRLLCNEGWHKVYLLDVIVTAPATNWWHCQAGEAAQKLRKTIDDNVCGHLVMQINAVAHKPETEAGSVSCEMKRPATYQRRGTEWRKEIREALHAQMRERR